MDNVAGKLIIAGLGAFAGWKMLGPERQQSLLAVLEQIGTAVVEAEHRKQLAAMELSHPSALVSQNAPTVIDLPVTSSLSGDPGFEIDWASMLKSLPSLEAKVKPPSTVEPDAQWRSVVIPPALVMIVGRRGSGKSALGYRLLELFRSRLAPYVVGVPSAARRLLPDWIGIVASLEDLPTRSIALVDEAYMTYHSRHSMASESKQMSQALNLSRQREQTLVFVSQEARQVDRNVSSSASVIVFKALGMLQLEFERPELRKLVEDARRALSANSAGGKSWSYVYSPDADHMGLMENELPSFWKRGLSRLFAVEGHRAKPRTGKRLTVTERTRKARELRTQGQSYAEIAKLLGVSKATVINYVKGYPYSSN